ncbi:hypothetical protein B296_00042749 [Ensete ventricosum]|uniref:Uncharacterized protein n=1 Tax=Ensete ventricosum TaxID=4639 RepID=A0A426ZHD7_ENSVE|nr:hypothetical protein B296_00042749 [Ensete ventricosum]
MSADMLDCWLALLGSEKSKQEESHPRSRNGGDREARAALLDITNDSPVVGLATGCLPVEKTPSSSAAKNPVWAGRTTTSGEEVLRGQVRTLLQKVEEEAEFVGRPTSGQRLFPALLGVSRSPAQILAPTPANTPQIPNLSCSAGGGEGYDSMEVATPFVLSEEDHREVVVVASNPQDPLCPQECVINRALMFDSPEKSEMSGISTITSSPAYQSGSVSSFQEKSLEEDNSSIWSIQVNASAHSDGDDDELFEDFDEDEEVYEEEEEEEEEDEDLLGDLCEGMKKMSVLGDEFAGKHTRFVYNSDGEIQGEEEVTRRRAVSPSALVLKGLPAPEGKHLRFQDEDEEEEED